MRNLTFSSMLILSLLWAGQAHSSAAANRGAELYAQHCASCHGRLNMTTKPNRPYGRLLSAIRVVPSMYSLKRLSREDLEAIVAATQQNK